MWQEEADSSGEGSGVLWRYWEWVGSGEFLTDLDLLQIDHLKYVSVADWLTS